MSHDAASSCGAAAEHSVAVPGGTIYYRTEGSGPPLVLIGGGPSNADTLGALAGPASLFATSAGALIGLELTASHPDTVGRVIVHEPPLAQLVPADDQASFDIDLDRDDAGAALDQIAESIGVTRGRSLNGSSDQPEVRRGDIELFIHRDVPAIANYQLDLDRITSPTNRIIVTASEDGREFYPHRCAEALAAALGTPLIELPGNHAAMITHPSEFAARLAPLLPRAGHPTISA
jgi:pimeloyl-ACP methyl ester carboxylesterase